MHRNMVCICTILMVLFSSCVGKINHGTDPKEPNKKNHVGYPKAVETEEDVEFTPIAFSPIMTCDIDPVLKKYGCGGCHNASNPKGQLDLTSPHVASRLVGVRAHSMCQDEKKFLIHPSDVEDSLLLKVLYPKMTDDLSCVLPMPPGNSQIEKKDIFCFIQWAASLVIEPIVLDESKCSQEHLSHPLVQLSKVKSVLIGLPPSSEEVEKVLKDPSAIHGMIGEWLADPTTSKLFYDKLFPHMISFLQQTGPSVRSLIDNFQYNSTLTPLWHRINDLVNNIKESMARTAIAIIQEDRSFREILTTRRFQMTTAMSSFLTLTYDKMINDRRQIGTSGGFPRGYKRSQSMSPDRITILRDGNIPLYQSLDPAHENYLKFTNRYFKSCLNKASVLLNMAKNPALFWRFLSGLFHCPPSQKTRDFLAKRFIDHLSRNRPCQQDFMQFEGAFDEKDFQDWRWMQVKKPAFSDHYVQFFELDKIRKQNVLQVDAHLVGFFTSPAFQMTWRTNEDNAARVTINQTLITALGQGFDGEDNVVPSSVDELLDANHASPGTECYACHKTMDPMKQLYRQSFTYEGFVQRDPTVVNKSGVFSWFGDEKKGNGVYDLARFLSESKAFAPAWVQKLCTYANSAPCNPNDPLFQEVVSAFVASNYNFKMMIQDLFSSPLVTNSKCSSKSSADAPSIARRSQFCWTLQQRLNVDVCKDKNIVPLLSILPENSFSRGSAKMLTIRTSNLFIQSTYQAICRDIAKIMVDRKDSPFSGFNSTVAIKALVERLAGISQKDSRYKKIHALLYDHFHNLIKGVKDSNGKMIVLSQSEAMQSTFMLACMSPTVLGIGF